MRIIYLFISMFILTSCSMRQAVLNNLDWIVINELDDTFDLNSKQLDIIKPQVEAAHLSLKKEYSQQLGMRLRNLALSSKDGISREELEPVLKFMMILRRDFMIKNSENLGYFFKGLSDRQLKHYQEELAERDEDVQELLDEDNFEEEVGDYVENRADRLKTWFGDLDDKQLKIVRKYIAPNKESLQRYVDRRRKKQDVFIAYIKEHDAKKIDEFFQTWAKDSNHRSKLADIEIRNWQKWTLDYFTELSASLNKDQREFFADRMNELAADLVIFSSRS